MKCCICRNQIEVHPLSLWDRGNNAQPVMDGRCCDVCNDTVVLTRRMKNAMNGQDRYEGKGLSLGA